MLDFSASVNPLGPPRTALDAYHDAAARIAAYPGPHPETLEQKFADTIGVDRTNVLAGNGSIQLIYLLARSLPSRHPHVIIPTFSEIANALIQGGSQPYPIASDARTAFAIDPTAIDAALSAGADAIWLGRPNSPTGSLIDDHVVEEIAARCARRDAWCIFDEAFIDFADGVTSAARLIARFPRTIVLRSLTKIYAIAGLRLGFVVAAQELIASLRDAIEPWSVNVAADAVGLACLDAGPDYLLRSRELVAAERDYLQRELRAVGGVTLFPSTANFILIEAASETFTGAFAKHLLDNGIIIRDLAKLPGCTRGMYRIAVRQHPDNERLVSAARSWNP